MVNMEWDKIWAFNKKVHLKFCYISCVEIFVSRTFKMFLIMNFNQLLLKPV